MTIFAGIVSRHPGAAVPEAFKSELATLLSRHPGEPVEQRQGPGFFLAKVDIGAYRSRGMHDDESGAVGMIAGDPLLADADADRYSDLKALHDACQRQHWATFASCQGSYCAAFFDPTTWQLHLVADKLGVRPIYYWVGQDWVVFSTAFRLMEQSSAIKRRMDVRGVTEKACFGFPLADRTLYEGVHTIGAGEIVSIDASRQARQHYWRWDELAPLHLPEAELDQLIYTRFKAAVKKRLRGDTVALSFLSGGLDSRAIVAALRDVGTHVHTLNFAPEQTQDEVFGAEIAKRLGTRHLALPQRTESFAEQQNKLFGLWQQSLLPNEAAPEHPRLAWSGDGGSVAVGHVYMTTALVRQVREGDVAGAAQAFLDRLQLAVPAAVIARDRAAELPEIPVRGIIEEINAQRCQDRGRALHLFLMLNDQRRHLADHFENIDLRRVELHLPFFDGQFLETILRAPIDDFLHHHFYNRWLSQFPAATREVPWQSYPGHEPCPLPAPAGLRYQWRDIFSADIVQAHRQRAIARGYELLALRSFPVEHIDRLKLRLAIWAMRLGLRDTRYVVKFVEPFAQSWGHCNGSGADV